MISVLHILVQSNLMRSRIVTEFLIKQLANILERCDPASFYGADEFLNALLATLENLSSNQKVLYNFGYQIIKYILPALFSKFNCDLQDAKFLSLKIFTDIVMGLLHDERTKESEKKISLLREIII